MAIRFMCHTRSVICCIGGWIFPGSHERSPEMSKPSHIFTKDVEYSEIFKSLKCRNAEPVACLPPWKWRDINQRKDKGKDRTPKPVIKNWQEIDQVTSSTSLIASLPFPKATYDVLINCIWWGADEDGGCAGHWGGANGYEGQPG